MELQDSVGTHITAGIVDVVVLAPALGTRTQWHVLTMRRAAGTRCTGAWEIVHGRIDAGERPADAAVREVLEETGLETRRLYSICVNPFYLHQSDTVQLAIVFAAVVDALPVTVGPEHDASAWLSPAAAARRLAWPRERQALAHVLHVLAHGHAGPLEDVLRISR